MKKRSTARNGWGLLRFGFNLRPLRVRSPPMTMTVDSFHSPGPGYHIRYQDLRGIHRAVIEGDTEKMQEIQQLLVFGLHDLNKRDRKNRTALHLACAIGSVDMVKILVLSQCQLNLRDGENRTALVKAVQCQEEACVDILLRKGADVNTKDFKDNTALHYAAYEGNISIARKLLLNKGDIEAKNKDGLTPLLVAVNEKKEKMVAFLLEEANINAVDYTNRSCLHLACANGHEDMVKLLVDRKCQLNLRDVENTTALLKAVQSQDEACVDILLKHGANPDLKDIKGNTALHYAALGDNVTIAQKLLLKKVNMEIRNKDGLTPLLLAINEKKEKMVAFLVEKANINAVDYAKRTALHLACAIGREDMVKLLVDRHCQLNLCDGEDRTALVKAIQCQEEACVTLLLEHGADPKVKDNKGNTALHYAAHEGIVSIAEKLLLQNANIEAKNTDGLTPVLVALNENKEQMVKFLVGKGARLLSGDTVKSDQLISEHEEEMKPENSSQNHDLVAKKSEEVSLSSRTCKADTDDSRPSKHEDLSSGTKTVPKLNLRKQMAAFLRPKKAKCGLVSQEDRPLFADNNFAREDKTETLCKPSVNVSDYSPLAFVSPETPQTSSAMLGVTKTVPKLNLRKQMAAFLRPKKAKCGLVSQEDRPLFADNNFAREDKTETLCKPSVNVSDYSPLAFVSPETPQTSSAMLGVTKTVPKLNLRKQMAAFLRPKKAKCGLVSQEDRPLFADNNFAREDKTETLCKPSVNVSDYSPLAFVSPETPQTSSAMLGVTKTGKERKQHTSNKMEGAENIYDAAAAAAAAPALGTALAVAAAAAAAAPAAGLIQQRKTGKTDNHLFPTTQNEDSDSNDPGLSIMEIKKIKM
ncbi:ankyrin repeat domain-containing protein 26-like isoform X3 [Canis lupus familiaris]|uniref:ankyrin repeat domain-containing protein 26-like isoform X3 n=1 Tax=Canis lupus familiaris TaxID=9615 RepID=UPI0018F4A995|nr:ankyrin repeat domain-containing protein 26-like isoform X3 [Canis lupus familiaris]